MSSFQCLRKLDKQVGAELRFAIGISLENDLYSDYQETIFTNQNYKRTHSFLTELYSLVTIKTPTTMPVYCNGRILFTLIKRKKKEAIHNNKKERTCQESMNVNVKTVHSSFKGLPRITQGSKLTL